MKQLLITSVLLATLFAAPVAHAGVVVVNHDTATLNTTSAGVAQFSRNLVQFLDRDGVAGGRVLVFNREQSLGNPANLADTFFASAVAGLNYTVEAASPSSTAFTLQTLQAFDGVLLAGRILNSLGEDIKNDAVLAQYVAGGGGVYIAAGVGFGGEAAYWNSFLDDFGIAFDAQLNNRVGINTVTGGEGPLFAGVTTLSAGNGNDVRLLSPRDPDASIVQFAPGSAVVGLTAVHVDQAVAAVPAPGSMALAGLGLVLLSARRLATRARRGGHVA